MSNWSNYQQKISPGFRNVVQALENYYTSQDISFDQFNTQVESQIESDLQSISQDSTFYLEYATSILNYANKVPVEFGTPSTISFYLMEKDKAHYGALQEGLLDQYPDFQNLINEEPETLAQAIFGIASQGDFFMLFAQMLVGARTATIWDHFALSYPIYEDAEAELLMNSIRDASLSNINSFRVFNNLSEGGLASIISDSFGSTVFFNILMGSINNRAKVIYSQYGEGNPSADLWDVYLSTFPEEKRTAIEFVKESGNFETVHQLSVVDFSVLQTLLNEEFFLLLAPYYLVKSSNVTEEHSFSYQFNGKLLRTGDSLPLSNFNVQVIDKNDTEFGDRLITTTSTNLNGYFAVELNVLSELLAPYTLDYKFTSIDDGRSYQLQQNFDVSNDGLFTFNVSHDLEDNSAILNELVSYDDVVVIPPTLDSFLATHNLNTLQDVRDFGGLSGKETLPTGTLSIAQRIDAHSNLELLHVDLEKEDYLPVSKHLIDEGFDSIPKIIKTDRYDFIKKMRVHFSSSFKLGQYDAGKIYEQADGVMSYITTRLNQGLTDRFKDFENDPDLRAALNDLKSNKCNCEDCKAGTSPLAYLTDLINYALKNVSEVTLSDTLIDGLTVVNLPNGKKKVTFEGSDLIEVEGDEKDMITHVTSSTAKFTLNELEAKFKHPFAQLPANCDSVNKKVCQVRVCIEVLWTHIFNPDTVSDSNDLLSADKLKEIRLGTYEYLLSELGTSYEEIRKFRVSSDEEKANLSQRLGIKEENLEELNLPYSEENDTIGDIKLEELFGYRDTTRNYLTTDEGEDLPNALVNTPKSRIATFKENYLRDQFHAGDFPSVPYSALGKAKIDPDIIFPSDFRVPDESNPLFALWQKRFDWLNSFASQLKGLKKKVSTFPKSKRVKLQVSLAEAQALGTFTMTQDDSTPVSLTPTDFTMNALGTEASFLVEETPPISHMPGSTVSFDGETYELGGEEEVDVSTSNSEESGKKSIFEKIQEEYTYTNNDGDDFFITPWVSALGPGDVIDEGFMDFLLGNIKNHEHYENTLVIIQTNFALNEEQFLRLYDLFDIDRKAKNDINSPRLSAEEIEELIDLTVTSVKNRLTVAWINEEDALVGGTLPIDTENFWEAEKDLVEGESPFPHNVSYFGETASLPLIDPEEINLKDLPDWKIGKDAVQLFNERQAALETAKVDIRNERLTYSESSDLGFSKTLDFVYGTDTLTQLNTVANNLSSSDTTISAAATKEIEDDFKMSLEEFTFIVALKSKCDEQDPVNQPSEEEWGQFFSTLLGPYKFLRLIENWKDDEEAYYLANINKCWKLRKPKLRKWRGGVAVRTQWVNELKTLQRQPIIDPYLITPAYMKGLDADDVVFSADNRVFQIWDNRRDYLEEKREALINDLGTTEAFQHINTFLQNELKITANFQVNSSTWVLFEDDLTNLKERQDNGFSIKKALKQLGFTRKSFEHLFEVRELLKLDGSILLTPPEREEIANLLVNILKRRFFTLWNLQEELDTDLKDRYPFALSPDFFMIPPPQEFTFPPLKEKEKPVYLFNNKEFKKWKRTLESKERIWKNNADSLERMISDTENRFLIPTRDAIIEHISKSEGISLEETHDFITRNLLIDSKSTSCASTTRVSQAIEALQVLLWGMHNNILLDEPNIAQLSLTAPDFDEEWKWLGSYATWRSAMFVQLYPENILLPSLKLNQSDQYQKALKHLSSVTSIKSAQQVFYEYFEYLNDVKTMELLGNVRLATKAKVGWRFNFSGVNTSFKRETLPNNMNCHFNIGRGNETESFYFRETHIDNSTGNIARQSEWIKIPHDIKGKYVGVDFCTIGNERNIHLFFLEDNQLMITDYDFRKNRWTEYRKLEFGNLNSWVRKDLDVKEYHIIKNSDGNGRPMIFYYGYDMTQFSNYTGYNDTRNYSNLKTDFTYEVFMMNKEGKADNLMFNYDRFYRTSDNHTINGKVVKLEDRIIKDSYKEFKPLYAYFDHGFKDGNYKGGALRVVFRDMKQGRVGYFSYFWWGLTYSPHFFTGVHQYKNDKVHMQLINDNNVLYNNLQFVSRSGNIVDSYVADDKFSQGQSGTATLASGRKLERSGFNPDSFASNSFVVNFDEGEKLYFFTKEGENEKIIEFEAQPSALIPTYSKHAEQQILGIPLNEEYTFDVKYQEDIAGGRDRNGRILKKEVSKKVNIAHEKLPALFQKLENDYQPSSNYFNLIHEGFYYLPLAIANKLTAIGEYEEAKAYYDIIFDFKQNIPYFYLLKENSSNTADVIEINDDWGSDNALNPHSVAQSKPRALRKSFYLQLINYFITYANYEFTQDNVESIARAKQLYLEAEDLLKVIQPEPADELNCGNLLNTYSLQIDSFYIQSYWKRLITRVIKIESYDQLEAFLQSAQSIWAGGGTEKERIAQIELELQGALAGGQASSVSDQMNSNDDKYVSASYLLANRYAKNRTVGSLANAAANRFDSALEQATGFNSAALTTAPLNVPFLEAPNALVPLQLDHFPQHEDFYSIDVVNGGSESARGERAIKKPEEIFKTVFSKKPLSIFRPSFEFCVAPNPMYKAFDLSIQLNLYKIRNSMNISGIQRSLEPFAAPTDATSGIPMIGVDGFISTGGLPIPQASPYRYDFLINRAKELIGLSQNIENSFLSALEKLDDEKYSLLKVSQDQEVAKANIRLQDLRIDEAETGIEAAALQTERARVQIDGLNQMIDDGLNGYEQTIIASTISLGALKIILTGLQTQKEIASSTGDLFIGVTGSNAGGIAIETAALTAIGIVNLATQISIEALNSLIGTSQIYAAQKRREQEWKHQISIASHDIKIGQVGEKLAQDRLRIVRQEKNIAELQLQHTDATINYLKNEQFTNAALYEFMVETLERVYSYFLQEATAAAKLASSQLAFERQKQLPEFIKGDYWIPEANDASSSAEEQPDRKGLTGSARLLQDITRLDQYAVSTDERKQRITKTISLASIAPYEFQQFKETGIITFATDMNLFDKDHPGHYMRLIKRVSTNVVALASPVDGIKASLSSIGLSRVVTGGPLYQTQDIRRSPETITLSAPTGNNGIFELAQDEKFLRPFEGNGVEGFWEFRMEKAANPNLNFNAVADILLTIEYEAINSFDYKAQVIRRLNSDNEYEAMLPISFKSNLPDQWFDISNPDQAATPFEVSFELGEGNFPVNVKEPIITNVLLYFPQEGDEDEEIGMVNFEYTEKGSQSKIGGYNLNTSEAKISTADANGTALNGILGKSVAGTWNLKLQDNATLRSLIAENKLSDILMVITFAGETPQYNL